MFMFVIIFFFALTMFMVPRAWLSNALMLIVAIMVSAVVSVWALFMVVVAWGVITGEHTIQEAGQIIVEAASPQSQEN